MTDHMGRSDAWDWSEPVTYADGTTHARETCECPRCVKDREIRGRVQRNAMWDDICWSLGIGRWGQ